MEDVEPGSRIGRFEVQDLLGRGGMGAVYAARDPELERSVAIKLIVEPDAHMTMRLLREAQALAQLQHPHVVAIHEVGQHGDGVFLAMELVDGTSLDRLQPKPTGWRELVALFVQAGRGLAAAHDKGLVHRDVKPSNLLVGRDGRVRIGDFGLARLAPRDGEAAASGGTATPDRSERSGRSASIDTTAAYGTTIEPPSHPLSPGSSGGMLDIAMTHDGAFLGTPRYMAPEQHACRPATARSDQFSFCVALWETLFGLHPFELSSMGFTDAVIAGRRAPLPRARAGVAPRWLIRALDRGLSADPDDRFPTMHALVDVLTRTPLRRRRIALGAGALATVAATATAAALLWPASDSRPAVRCDDAGAGVAAIWGPAQRAAVAARFAAQRPDHGADTARLTAASIDRHAARWSTARVDACRATHERGEQSPELLDRRMGCLDRTLAATGAVLATLATAGPEQVDGALATVDALPDPAACSAERLSSALPLPDDPRATAIVDGLARLEALRAAGDLPAARTLVGELRAQADALDHPGLRAEVLTRQAPLIAETDPAGSRATLEQAMSDAVRANDRDLEAKASILLLGHAVQRDDRAGMEALMPLARAAAQRQGISSSIAVSFVLTEEKTLARLGRYDDALAVCARMAALPGIDATQPARCRCANHSDALHVAEASAACRAALDAYRARFGPSHPETTAAMNNAAIALSREGRHAEALEMRQAVLAAQQAQTGDSLLTAIAHYNLAVTLGNLSRHLEAEEHVRRSLALRERLETHPSRAQANAHLFLAELLASRRDADGATHHAAEGLRRAQEVLGPDHPDVALYLSSFADIQVVLARWREGLAAYDRCDAFVVAHLGAAVVQRADCLHGRARALLGLGRRRDAARAAEHALSILRATAAPAEHLDAVEDTLAKTR